MNYLVIGAGNAGRPVARLLNNQNHKVIITDPKQLSDFKQDVQSILKQMEKEGVILDLGNDNPSMVLIKFIRLQVCLTVHLLQKKLLKLI